MRRLLRIGSWLVLATVAAGGVVVISAYQLNRWQPIQGTPDEISRRFLADLPPATSPEGKEGRALVAEIGCVRCHTTDLGGGRLVEGPFGHVKTANLTPDVTGLEHVNIDVLTNALRKGIDDDGAPLPNRAMPWDLIGHLSDGELRSVLAYLQSIPRVQRGNSHLLAGGSVRGEVHMPLVIPPEARYFFLLGVAFLARSIAF